MSPNCSNNKDNESKKRKAAVDADNIDQIRHRTISVILLQTQENYLNFLCSTHDSDENGKEEISASDHLKNLQVIIDNLERQR